MMYGLDPQYATQTNPLAASTQTLSTGRKLFEQHCARCHGASGHGDGPDAAKLSPPPANIAAASKMPMASDGYLFWTISEGGAPTGSAMPPFKQALTNDEIWKIITYLRTL
jgi:mono/diheme cytochrome c family protein